MSRIFGGLRPDVTPAQVVAVLLAGIPIISNLLRAFGVFELSLEQQQALGEAVQWGGISAVGLFIADAGLRAARNSRDAMVEAAALAPAQVPLGPAPDDEDLHDDAGADDDEALGLVSDEEEFANPPAVQPSQVGYAAEGEEFKPTKRP